MGVPNCPLKRTVFTYMQVSNIWECFSLRLLNMRKYLVIPHFLISNGSRLVFSVVSCFLLYLLCLPLTSHTLKYSLQECLVFNFVFCVF